MNKFTALCSTLAEVFAIIVCILAIVSTLTQWAGFTVVMVIR